MTIYIKIPVLANNPIYSPEDFVADYLATVGEIYVLNNMVEESGVMQMTGSHRITEEQAVELESRWPMMSYSIDEFPFNWIPEEVS